MKRKQSGSFERGPRWARIQCGWYENRTNLPHMTFYHTNQWLGPVKVFADYSEHHDEMGMERELKLDWSWFFGRGSYGLSWSGKWRLGSFLPSMEALRRRRVQRNKSIREGRFGPKVKEEYICAEDLHTLTKVSVKNGARTGVCPDHGRVLATE